MITQNTKCTRTSNIVYHPMWKLTKLILYKLRVELWLPDEGKWGDSERRRVSEEKRDGGQKDKKK